MLTTRSASNPAVSSSTPTVSSLISQTFGGQLSGNYTLTGLDNGKNFYVNGGFTIDFNPAELPVGFNVRIVSGGTYSTTLKSDGNGFVGLSGLPTTISLGAVGPSYFAFFINDSGYPQVLEASADIFQAYNGINGYGARIISPVTVIGDPQSTDNAGNIVLAGNPSTTSPGAVTVLAQTSNSNASNMSFSLLIGGWNDGVISSQYLTPSGTFTVTSSTSTTTIPTNNFPGSIGSIITGPGIPQGTYVTGTTSTSITVNNAPTQTIASGTVLNYYSPYAQVGNFAFYTATNIVYQYGIDQGYSLVPPGYSNGAGWGLFDVYDFSASNTYEFIVSNMGGIATGLGGTMLGVYGGFINTPYGIEYGGTGTAFETFWGGPSVQNFMDYTKGAKQINITIGRSPFSFSPSSYTINSNNLPNGHLYIEGGVVTAISLLRQGGTSISLPTSTASVYLKQNDTITITYTTAPTLTFLPS